MNMLEIALISIFAALIIRLSLAGFYGSWIKQGVFGDSAYHYCIIRSLCEGHYPYNGVPEFFLKNGPDRYPILFHRFSSLFGLSLIERFPYIPNLFLFGIFAGVFPTLIYLTPEQAYPGWLDTSWLTPLLSNQDLLGILSVLLFLTSVANNSLRGDGILFLSLSERLLAKLSVGLYFFTAALWLEDRGGALYVVSVALGCIAIYSSMFGRQALLFTTLFWAVVALDVTVILPLFGALVISTIIGGKDFLLGLRDQWEFSTSYRRYTAKSRVFTSSLSRFSTLKSFSSMRVLISQIINYEPGKSMFRHPDLIFIFLLGLNSTSWKFISLIIATILVYLLTTTNRFHHFGESERYIDYNLAFIVPFVMATQIMSQPTSGDAILIITIAAFYRMLLIAVSLFKDTNRFMEGSENLIKILNQARITKNSRVLPLPINLGQTISARTGCGVVCYPGVYGAWIFERYIDEYPLFKRPLSRLVKEFEITHIVINKDQTHHFSKIVGWAYDLSDYIKIAENEHWSCYYVR